MRISKDNRLQEISDFYCVCCGKRGIPIIRKPGKQKEPGHLKKLYCLYCQQEQNMVEIRQNCKYSLEDFEIEYKYGNFENGLRKLPYKQFIANIKEKNL